MHGQKQAHRVISKDTLRITCMKKKTHGSTIKDDHGSTFTEVSTEITVIHNENTGVPHPRGDVEIIIFV